MIEKLDGDPVTPGNSIEAAQDDVHGCHYWHAYVPGPW